MKNKKFGFTLAEMLITVGLIGSLAALTIPTLAYNYRSKVLEEQFRSTYSDIMQTGAMMSKDNGDIGTYSQKVISTGTTNWAQEFMSHMTGGGSYDKNVHWADGAITAKVREIYKSANAPQGPYSFRSKSQLGIICDNGGIWTDSKGRLWTFNAESGIVCVDINGTAAPNRVNIDLFAFIPATARDIATYIYDNPTHVSDYSGQFVLCDLELIHSKGISNKQSYQVDYEKGTRDNPKSVMDACPFNAPIENIAPSWETKDANGNTLKTNANYWKDYIHYK
jgi:prepilin-type N-terminal cleavage/methylation domain-containing protein